MSVCPIVKRVLVCALFLASLVSINPPSSHLFVRAGWFNVGLNPQKPPHIPNTKQKCHAKGDRAPAFAAGTKQEGSCKSRRKPSFQGKLQLGQGLSLSRSLGWLGWADSRSLINPLQGSFEEVMWAVQPPEKKLTLTCG